MFGYCTGAMGAGAWIVMVALWGAVLALAVWAVTRFFPSATRGDRHDEAVELLERRLAAGEIDPQTFRQTRDELSGASRR